MNKIEKLEKEIELLKEILQLHKSINEEIKKQTIFPQYVPYHEPRVIPMYTDPFNPNITC